MKKLLLSTCFISASLLAGNALAGDNKVNFYPGGPDSFYCTASKDDAKIRLSTNHVDVVGFCTSEPGKLEISGKDLNKYYFQVKRDTLNTGSVTARILNSKGDVTCQTGDNGRSQYVGNGQAC